MVPFIHSLPLLKITISMKRLFVAVKIHPSPEFLKIYNNLKTNLKFADIKWVKPEIIHVTLKFFGETEEKKIPEISKVLKAVATRHLRFETELVNVGIFGSSYDPRVIWFGMQKAEPLKALAEDVLSSVEKIGWERDRQNFVPHLTIARIKHVPDKRLFQTFIDEHKNAFIQQVSVADFHLYESILQREGPVYRILESFALK
jgi:2'-5' RNA ligase